eukprot:8108142-Ditylum_brightwellii.AAC.2
MSQCKSTSLLPSGRHYRHYRAALTLEEISLVHATMMALPFLLGFTPIRWQKAIDIMLEKDPGSPKITQLQIIVIVEGNMNAIMKVIWNKRLVPVAENRPDKPRPVWQSQRLHCTGCTSSQSSKPGLLPTFPTEWSHPQQ